MTSIAEQMKIGRQLAAHREAKRATDMAFASYDQWMWEAERQYWEALLHVGGTLAQAARLARVSIDRAQVICRDHGLKSPRHRGSTTGEPKMTPEQAREEKLRYDRSFRRRHRSTERKQRSGQS